MLKITKLNFNLFLVVFLTTLHSYYFYSISLAPFPIIALLILAISVNKINLDTFKLMVLFYIMLITNSLIGFFYSGSLFYFNSLIGIILGPLFLALFYEKYKFEHALVARIIKWVIVVHVFAFYTQFFVYYLLGYKIDFLGFVTGEQARIEGTGVLTDLIRSSGLFNEPASYSLYVAFFSFVLLTYNRRMDVFVFVAIVSCFLSFSVGGIVYAVLAFLYYFIFIEKKIINKLGFIVFLSVIVAYFAYEHLELINLYLSDRFVNSDQDVSSNVRFKEGFDYFFNQPLLSQFTGLGIGNYPKDVSTVASGYMAIFVHFGYFFTIIFLFLKYLFIKINGYRLVYVLIFLFFLSSTVTFLNLHYWMFFAIIGILSHSNSDLSY